VVDERGSSLSRDSVEASTDAELEDEALAAAARARYRTDGIPSIEPDGSIRSALGADEKVLAFRQGAAIERLGEPGTTAVSGPLAVTSERLLFIDGHPMTLAVLEELEDVTVATDRLMVMLRSGSAFSINADQPRLLRVQLAEARARRLDQTVASSPASRAPTDSPRR